MTSSLSPTHCVNACASYPPAFKLAFILLVSSRIDMAHEGDTSTVSTAVTRAFIDQRASTFHEAFGIDSQFNATTSKYQSKDVW